VYRAQWYAERDVELACAANTHRVHGATVDTAHVLLTEDTTGETLYVPASRARHTTTWYVATEPLVDVDAERAPPAAARRLRFSQSRSRGPPFRERPPNNPAEPRHRHAEQAECTGATAPDHSSGPGPR
jgi:hypothetical protein